MSILLKVPATEEKLRVHTCVLRGSAVSFCCLVLMRFSSLLHAIYALTFSLPINEVMQFSTKRGCNGRNGLFYVSCLPLGFRTHWGR